MERDWLAAQFEDHRSHLRAVAYRMLGSVSDADDAVQEAWLRLSRADTEDVENLRGWLTTVVARLCLNVLRSRKAHGEESIEQLSPDMLRSADQPDAEAQLADSVGLAMLVVLQRLEPAERLAFVLHDMFDLPFEEIARIVERTPAAARQLASRARSRVRGGETEARLDVDQARQREVVEAFLAASRKGDFDALLAMLDPDVVVRVGGFTAEGRSGILHGAAAFLKRARGNAARYAAHCHVLLVNGAPGIVFAPRGQVYRAMKFVVQKGRISEIEVIGDPERLMQLDLAMVG